MDCIGAYGASLQQSSPTPFPQHPGPSLQEPALDYLSWSELPSWGAPMDSSTVSSSQNFFSDLFVFSQMNKLQ